MYLGLHFGFLRVFWHADRYAYHCWFSIFRTCCFGGHFITNQRKRYFTSVQNARLPSCPGSVCAFLHFAIRNFSLRISRKIFDRNWFGFLRISFLLLLE